MQQPGPPIIIGGGGTKRTPALAAQFAAEFNLPFAPSTTSAAAFERVRAACEAIDRDPATRDCSAALVVCCGADEAEVERRAAAIGREPDELRENGPPARPTRSSPASRVARRRRRARIYLQVLDLADLDHLRLIADEVLPHV